MLEMDSLLKKEYVHDNPVPFRHNHNQNGHLIYLLKSIIRFIVKSLGLFLFMCLTYSFILLIHGYQYEVGIGEESLFHFKNAPIDGGRSLRNFYYVNDFDNFIKSEINGLKVNLMNSNMTTYERNRKLATLMDALDERLRILTANSYHLTMNGYYGQLKAKMAQELSETLQEQFHALQNPSNCSDYIQKAILSNITTRNENSERQLKFLLCDINNDVCGFGCQIHHLMYCFNEAVHLNRTFLLDSSNWTYTGDKGGYETYFIPLSQTCYNITDNIDILAVLNQITAPPANGTDKSNSTSTNATEGVKPLLDIIKLPRMYLRRNEADDAEHWPLFVKTDLKNRIRTFHSSPFIWWSGQLLKYLMRWQPEYKLKLDDSKQVLNLKRPYIGIHVRRTDKKLEADYLPLSKYLDKANEYFKLHKEIQLQNGQHEQVEFNKTIYLLTDDPTVINEEVANYTNEFKFIYNEQAIIETNRNRNTQTALDGLFYDLQVLLDSDYVVCTFSSNLCRLAYEQMQSLTAVDSMWKFTSLDSNYFFDDNNTQIEECIHEHRPLYGGARNDDDVELLNELDMAKGDHVRLLYYAPTYLKNGQIQTYLFYNGIYKNATNLRTNKTGLYPAYKTIE